VRASTLAVTLLAASAPGGSAFAAWQTVGQGVDASVNALLPAQGKLYAAGSFFNADKQKAHFIAAWDGAAWSPLGDGLGGYFAESMVIYHDDLYVGGNITGGTNDHPAIYLSRWTGSAWVSVGKDFVNPGVSYVTSLCVYKDKLYAGGDGGLAVFEDTGWARFQVLGGVAAMRVYHDELYLGGNILKVGDNTINKVAKWNGSGFAEVAGGVFDTMRIGDQVSNKATISSFMEYQGDLYVGGSFTRAGNGAAANLARWNGAEWSAVGAGADGPVMGLTPFEEKLHVVGLFTHAGGDSADGAASWNGSAWSVPHPGLGFGGYVCAEYQAEIYCGGNFSPSLHNNIVKWSGAAALRSARSKARMAGQVGPFLGGYLFGMPGGGLADAAGRRPLTATPR
jgi:hypothetical protein